MADCCDGMSASCTAVQLSVSAVVDGRIMRFGVISSGQSADDTGTSDSVKSVRRCWSRI